MLKQTVFAVLNTDNLSEVARFAGVSPVSVHKWGPVVPYKSGTKIEEAAKKQRLPLKIDRRCYDENLTAINDIEVLIEKGVITKD